MISIKKKTQISITHTYMLSKRINLGSMFIAYFSPGVHGKFFMEGSGGREEPHTNETQHHSPLQCHFKSQIKAK